MSISSQRFAFALDQIKGSDWHKFELLASAFLVAEFASIRTMASPSGDGGRDSALFNPDGMSYVAIQYSVEQQWSVKIRSTITRLKTTFPDTKTLIYMTNQTIGAAADKLRPELMRDGIMLDIRDRAWFIERLHLDTVKANAARELAEFFVSPLIATYSIDEELVTALTENDARSALMFLEMQSKDTGRDYGLTKSSFDALVRAALRNTNTSSRLSRESIIEKVCQFLHSHNKNDLTPRINASLTRLQATAIRYRRDKDEFHLNDAEIDRIADSASEINALRNALENDINDIIIHTTGVQIQDAKKFSAHIRRVIEIFFLRKGNEFAAAALTGKSNIQDSYELKSIAIENTKKNIGVTGKNATSLTIETVNSLLSTTSPEGAKYLNLLMNSYTMFAFLSVTPDVQKVTKAMFGHGILWLDTSVVLPVLAETSHQDDNRPFTAMLRQAKSSGLKLYVTPGILEEIERHINRCISFTNSDRWVGNVPYLYTAYALTGRNPNSFNFWLETFAGSVDPLQDIADFLRANLQIVLQKPEDPSNLSSELISEVREAWKSVQDERRSSAREFSMHSNRLAEHDAENYLQVLSSRVSQAGKAPLGYSVWWLTMDSAARKIQSQVSTHLWPNVKFGPVMSLDFLLRYLAFGPNRDRPDLNGALLSQIYAGDVMDALPSDLLKAAAEVRAQSAHLPEHIVRRRIRDKLNIEKSRSGSIEAGGLQAVHKTIRDRL